MFTNVFLQSFPLWDKVEK